MLDLFVGMDAVQRKMDESINGKDAVNNQGRFVRARSRTARVLRGIADAVDPAPPAPIGRWRGMPSNRWCAGAARSR